jgi:hypothetical protein
LADIVAGQEQPVLTVTELGALPGLPDLTKPRLPGKSELDVPQI